MSDLQQPKDQTITPVASMLTEAAAANIVNPVVLEQTRNPTLQHITKAKGINHVRELTVSGPKSTK
jgi:hypothetical protein